MWRKDVEKGGGGGGEGKSTERETLLRVGCEGLAWVVRGRVSHGRNRVPPLITLEQTMRSVFVACRWMAFLLSFRETERGWQTLSAIPRSPVSSRFSPNSERCLTNHVGGAIILLVRFFLVVRNKIVP